tara:strand:- start:450 stop:1271 length:822 start_codon:yes stop_codon:yes gene_type:complete
MVMRLLDLFSGIGGFSYAAEKLVGGYETVAFCEQDEFCQKVLRKHWKDVPIYDDVRTIDAARLGRIDIVAGGFPCQAVSQAGLQKATEDDRWLWDEMLRIIQDCKPRWVIGENVVGLININEGVLFEQVQTDLEKEGYSVQSVVIPACAKNAPHRRDRVWIVSNSNSHRSKTRLSGQDKGQIGNTEKSINRDNRQRGWETIHDRATQRKMGYLDDGISKGLLRHFDREPEHIPRVTTGEKDRSKKLRSLGNSIVPQVAAEIFNAIKVAEHGEQ